MREFCGVAKSDGCWNRGDPLCFSWDIELVISFTPATTGALCSSSVDEFSLVVSLK